MQKKKFYTVRGYELLNKKKNPITPAMEDYLEMIYRNKGQGGYIRIGTLSELLNVKPSSTTKMAQRLAFLGFLEYEKYGIIFMTEKGEKLGRFLLERHNILLRFFKILDMPGDIFAQTEVIEHYIGCETLKHIKLITVFLEKNSHILKEFQDYKGALSTSEKV